MSLPDGFAIRGASIVDLATLVAHRQLMFLAMGYHDDAALDLMSAQFRVWVRPRVDSGEYRAWLIASPDGSIAAGAGLWLMDWPPHMIGKGPRRGNILNVYTHQSFRRRGLARCLIETALQWCRENGVDTVILHASDSGRELYESLGFTPTNEMRLAL